MPAPIHVRSDASPHRTAARQSQMRHSLGRGDCASISVADRFALSQGLTLEIFWSWVISPYIARMHRAKIDSDQNG